MATKNQSAGQKAAATKAANKAKAATEEEVKKPAAPTKPVKAAKPAKEEPVEEAAEEGADEGADESAEEAAEETSTVSRKDIADDIRNTLREEGLAISEKVANATVKAYEAAIAGFLAGGNTINLPGFGKFSLKTREARQTRNPRTGEPVDVAASMVPVFKCGKVLKDAAATAFESAESGE